MDEVAGPLKETLENSRKILSRCNELCARTDKECPCKAGLEIAGTEINDLKAKITDLERNKKEQQAVIGEMLNEIKELKEMTNALMRENKSSTRRAHDDFEKAKEQTGDVVETTLPAETENTDERQHLDTQLTKDEKEPGTQQKTQEAASDEVSVVKQNTKLVPFAEAYWRKVSQEELNESRQNFSNLEGVHTILCIDISESMTEENGWQQAATFVQDYLNGLKVMSNTHGMSNEYVAMVTFGHETLVKQRYSNNYDELLQVFGKLKLGGPSPLFGGMLMSLAAAWCSKHKIMRVGHGTHVGTRIIIISDGRPTNHDLIEGPDSVSSLDTDQTVNIILKELSHFKDENFDVFFVPVGNTDKAFFELMLGVADGVMLDHNSGKRLSRRHFLSTKVVDVLGLMPMPFPPSFLDDDLSEEDKADMKSIQERTKKCVFSGISIGKSSQDFYHERQGSTLPTIGSRVRRGPDWQWNQQDSSGPGTVIGHDENDDQAWVQWDADDHQNIYRYGMAGYDILIVDEPRKISDKHSLLVGCSVKPGEKWKTSDPPPKKGVVIKVQKGSHKATVRWDSGKRGEYSYNAAMEEIVYCPPFEPFSSGGYTLGYAADDTPDEAEMNRRNEKFIIPK